MWSIAAVLFHLLCGHAPYAGSSDDEGASMLINIIKTAPKWERLEQAGISTQGIDFVQRALVIEPSQRARELELLSHPWINPDGPDLKELRATDNNDVDELDASQLSLADKAISQSLEHDIDDSSDPREAKRSKRFQSMQPEPEIDLFRGLGQGQGWTGDSTHQWTENFTLDSANVQVNSGHPGQGNRLFGEIGSSALRSSGVLGQDVNLALQVLPEGSHDHTSRASSDMEPEMASAENVSYVKANSNSGFFDTENSSAQHSLRYPHLPPETSQSGTAPSLFGTEAFLDQMNMASPESGMSATSADSKQASPKSSTDLSPTSGLRGEKGSTPPSKSLATDVTPKQMGIRKAEQEVQNGRHSTQNFVQHEPKFSLHNAAVTDSYPTLSPNGQAPETCDTLNGPKTQLFDDGQRAHAANKSEISLLPTAFNSQNSEQYILAGANPGPNATSPRTSSSQTITSATATAGPVAIQAPQNTVEQTGSFTRPASRFGNLTPTHGSVPSIPIKISAQTTTFGRHPSSDFTHPNALEDRIPKHALDITMWYPNMERDIAMGKHSWHLNEDLTAILSTRTSRYVKVNGIRLMKGNGCWLYGKLKTGDVITVFEPPEGIDMTSKSNKQKEFLKFRCEFFVGGSKEQRSPEDPFVVEKEEEKYKQYEVRKSRESTAAKSSQGSEPLPATDAPTQI